MESLDSYVKGKFLIYVNMERDETRFVPETPQEIAYEEEKYSIGELRLNGKALIANYANGLNTWNKSSIMIKKGKIKRKFFEQLARNYLDNMEVFEREKLAIVTK